jgi:hypothetical protein
MADPEEAEPRESEATAQDEQTIMPWIWGGIGVIVVALFIAFMVMLQPQTPMRHPPAATPLAKPASQTY